jgi:hypothetical protein
VLTRCWATSGPHSGHERPDRSGQQRSPPAGDSPSSPRTLPHPLQVVATRRGSLTRKRSQVQTLSRHQAQRIYRSAAQRRLSADCQRITSRDCYNTLSTDRFGWLQAGRQVGPRGGSLVLPPAPRVEGSGRTVLACPTPSRKRRQPTRHLSRPWSAILLQSGQFVASTTCTWRSLGMPRHPPSPGSKGQGRPPGQAFRRDAP